MTDTQQLSIIELQVKQLGEARNLVLKDPAYWPQVLQGVLPIITNPVVEVRRWGADFLAETFSTPVLDTRVKHELALLCLDSLRQLSEENEASILKSVVQCSASLYPIIFRHICSNRNDIALWNTMATIKSRILNLWDTAPIGVRLCCIKFVQRVILVQSRGVTDPRLVDRSELNLGTVPSNHPLLSLPSLDAEAQGLLDRLLSILQENQSEPALITATINNLGPIIKTRPPLVAKVLNSVMSFNPFNGITRPITVQNRLLMISMEKTIRSLCLHIMRSNPSGPYVNKLSQHVARLSQMKNELNEEFSRKRAASSQDNEVKRVKVERSMVRPTPPTTTPTATPPPLVMAQQPITGPISFAELYTLATDPGLTQFEGQQLPHDLVVNIIVGSLYSMQSAQLDAAISAIKERYSAVLVADAKREAMTAARMEPSGRRDIIDRETREDEELQLQLGEFRLAPPSCIPPDQLKRASLDSMDRMFGLINEFDKKTLMARKSKLGVGRLAANDWDREGWVSVLIRLATRGLSYEDQIIKPESTMGMADSVRERLYNYVVEDFRGRMDVAIAWLNEEWYNDMVYASNDKGDQRQPQYQTWMMKVMDAIFPFLEARDRTFMRMLSEIPEITVELLDKVKVLCLDPDRTALGIQMLHFLAMLRPPVRKICLDVLEELWQNHPDLRKQVQKLLQKWRPEALIIKDKAEVDNDGMIAVNGTINDPPAAATA
ncbi:hypothetical protein EDC01DRAFT_717765 [Geopyxis carbonaria]|nr:hypothetical protein EDC01DRAFT_717765 [Geopyxis carbonaria]